MKIRLIGEPKTVMSNPFGKANYFAWPSIARLQNGRIAAVASGYRYEHICPFGKAVIAYSEDECESFGIPACVIDTPLDDRDAGITPFGEAGVIMTSFNNAVSFQRTINRQRGDTEKRPATKAFVSAYLDTVTPEEEEKYLGSEFCFSNDGGVTFGPLYKSPVTSPHGPLELKDGTLLWVGRIFSSNDTFSKNPEGVQVYKIRTDGTTEYVSSIEPCCVDGKTADSCEPHTVELPDGTLICHIRVQKYAPDPSENIFTVFQSESKDKGRSWSKPHQILDRLGGSPAHLFLHSSGVLISTYGYRQPPFGVKVMFSKDGGATWETGHDLYINGLNEDLGYPCTVELKDKSLFTVFYAHPAKGAPAVILGQKWSFEDED